jgi:hypothetical protein
MEITYVNQKQITCVGISSFEVNASHVSNLGYILGYMFWLM